MAKKSLKDRFHKKRTSSFIGREQQLDFFQQNLSLDDESESYKFIFNIYGQGGVGKTTLVRQFEEIAQKKGAIYAYTNEDTREIPEVLHRFSQQLIKQGAEMKRFTKYYKLYLQEKKKLESDPEAPKGLLTIAGRALAKGTITATKTYLPGSEIVLGHIESDKLIDQAGEWTDFIRKKLTHKDEIELLLDPVGVLTPLFLEDLNELDEKIKICFFFDTYEVTVSNLDEWIRKLLQSDFGEAPYNLLAIIASRKALNPNTWSDFAEFLLNIPLEPFTEIEAQRFLERKNITKPELLQHLMELSGRLPILLATLTDFSPDQLKKSDLNVSTTAVDRFLKWIDNPHKRKLALHLALPRKFNQDIVQVLFPDIENLEESFDWLCQRPFVQQKEGYWTYHPVVRDQMLKYQMQRSHKNWDALHSRLFEFYLQRNSQLVLGDIENQIEHAAGRMNLLEAHYHYLIVGRERAINELIPDFIKIHQLTDKGNINLWIETILEVEELCGYTELGKSLYEGYLLAKKENWQVLAELLENFNQKNLIKNSEDKAYSLCCEGYLWYDAKEYLRAVSCYIKSLNAKPDLDLALRGLGRSYFSLKDYQNAIKYYEKALENNLTSTSIWTSLGASFGYVGKIEKALDCYTKVVEIDKENEIGWWGMGTAYTYLKRYHEAIECFLTAMEFNPDRGELWLSLGTVYVFLGDFQKSIGFFEKSLEGNDNSDWVWISWVNMGEAFDALNNYSKALACFKNSLKLKPNHHHIWYMMGLSYLHLEDYFQAATCYEKSLEIQPDQDSAWYNMGIAYGALQEYAKSIECYEKSVEIEPDQDEAWNNMGNAYFYLQEYAKSIECYEKSVEIKPEQDDTLHSMGWTYLLWGKFEEARAYLRKVWDNSDFQHTHSAINLGHTYLLLEQDRNEAIEWYKKSIGLRKNVEDFYTRMESDYEDLQMGKRGISQEKYQALLEELKEAE